MPRGAGQSLWVPLPLPGIQFSGKTIPRPCTRVPMWPVCQPAWALLPLQGSGASRGAYLYPLFCWQQGGRAAGTSSFSCLHSNSKLQDPEPGQPVSGLSTKHFPSGHLVKCPEVTPKPPDSWFPLCHAVPCPSRVPISRNPICAVQHHPPYAIPHQPPVRYVGPFVTLTLFLLIFLWSVPAQW